MASTSNRKSEILIVCNTQQAQEQLKQIKTRFKEVKAEMKELANAGLTNTQRYKDLSRESKNLSKTISVNETNLNRVKNVLNDLSNSSLRQVNMAIRDLKKSMNGMSMNSPGLKQARRDMQTLQNQVRKLKGETVGFGNAWQRTFAAVGAYMGITMIIGKVQQMLTKVISLNLKFSDQLADIRKVSGLTIREINDLSSRLAKIDTRTSIEELNQIAYAGAKLGMGKYGAEGLEGFVKAANQVNVALKEDLGQDALTALAKITETMGLIPKMGVEKSMLATGSAMFQLSATSTATAGNIVEFSKRLTGLAKVTGVTIDQLLGLASASDAMFLMPEVSATAFNKLFTSIQTKHNLIEKELAIEPGTINNLYTAGKAMDAMVLIFEKMKEKGNMNALQSVFKDLGSNGARLVNVMVTMSENVDMLKSHLEISKEAFEEANAVTKEYNIQQETAQALMQRASNVWEKAFVNPDGVDSVKQMAQAWYDLAVQLTGNPFWMGQMKFALESVILAVRTLIYLLPSLLAGLMFKGVVGGIISIYTAIRNMNTGLTIATVKTQGLTAAFRTLNAAQTVNFLAGLITVAMTLVTVFKSLKSSIDDSSDSMEKFDGSTKKVESSIAVALDEAKRLKEAIDNATEGTHERAAAIKNFNDKFGQYYKTMLTEKSTADEIAKAYERVNKALKAKVLLQAKEKDIEKFYQPGVESSTDLLYDYTSLANGGKYSQFNGKWLKGLAEDSKDRETAKKALAAKLKVDRKGAQEKEKDYDDYLKWAKSSFFEQITSPSKYKYFKGYTIRNTDAEDLYLRGAAFIDQYFNNVQTMLDIDKKYEPFADDMNFDFNEDDKKGPLKNLAPDKDALKAAKAAEQERKRQLREELKEAQDQARAVIDNIKNFYQRQITEVTKVANEQGWDASLLQSATDVLMARQNLALSQARKGIAEVKNNWEEFKTTMQDDMIEKEDEVGYNESRVLLKAITKNNLKALHDKIVALNDALQNPTNAALDEIWKNASLNEKANETAVQRRLRERQRLMLEDSYTTKVDHDYSESMTKLGYFDVTETQAQTLVNGGEQAEKLLTDRAAQIAALFENTRNHITDIVSIKDVTSEEGRNTFLDILFGKGWDKARSELKEVFDLTGEDLKQFYSELIKYSDDYTEAQKKAVERQKKLIDFQWRNSQTYIDQQKAEKDVEIAGKGISQFLSPERPDAEKYPYKDQYGTRAFVSSMGEDPEVLAYRMKIQAAKAYYDFLAEHAADPQILREQEQKILEAQMAYAEHVAAQVKQRISDIYGLMAPIEDFGTQIGEAFATMTEDAEEGRKAMRKAIGDMINAFMKQTVEMTKEYLKRRIMQKMNDRLTQIQMKKQAKAETGLEDQKQDDLLGIQKVGGEAKKILTESVGKEVQSATAEIGQQTLQTQQVQTQQEVQMESNKTQANTLMGIASGASKIIGSLGWWGIPLIAVITALLNGLLSFAMSKVSSLFGGGGSSSDSGPSAKLVTGMLTYDSGNVQAFGGVLDGNTYPVVGNDGRVYAAKDGGELSTGLVKDPITTLVNGQPALVAERGPEIVIGRETTAAMMMARPDILAEIVKFDRQRSGRTYRAYDSGNVAEIAAGLPDSNGMDVAKLNATIDSLVVLLAGLQQNGIQAHVNKYGRGGVVNEAESGRNFMRRNSGDKIWRR